MYAYISILHTQTKVVVDHYNCFQIVKFNITECSDNVVPKLKWWVKIKQKVPINIFVETFHSPSASHFMFI